MIPLSSVQQTKARDQIAEGDYELAKGKEKTILTRLHRKLMNQLKSMGIEDFKEQRKYTVTGPVMASMALLIKVHKKNFPGRAYVPQINDPSYKICTELTDILNSLDVGGLSYIRDTYHFKETINNIDLREGDRMGTLDIVGMFPNVPVKQTLQVTRDKLEKDETLSSRTKWSVDEIVKLLEISIETYFKTIDGKIYFQRDGLPIGKSISKPLAGIYMLWFEENHVFKAENEQRLVYWKREMDDIFFVWRGTKDELEEFVWHLNGVEFKIKFTLNHEENGFIAFLDVGVTKKGGKLVTNVCRKPIHMQQYINWHSNHPKNLLLGVMKGLIHRAHVLCDEKQDLLDELSLLRDVFIANGYPEQLVNDTLKSLGKSAVLMGVEQEVRTFHQLNTMMFCIHLGLMCKVFWGACKEN